MQVKPSQSPALADFPSLQLEKLPFIPYTQYYQILLLLVLIDHNTISTIASKDLYIL